MTQETTDQGIKLLKPARLLEGSLTKPISFQTGAEANYFGHFGIDDDQDAQRLFNYLGGLLHKHTGSFTRPEDYQMPLKSGRQQATEAIQYAEFTYRNTAQYQEKMEKAQKKAALFAQHRWILKTKSKFSVCLAAVENGAVVDYTGANEAIMQQLEREMFYQGAYMVVNIKGRAYSPKKVGDKYGVTAMLQHVLFVNHGEKLFQSSRPASEVFKGWAGYSAVDPTNGYAQQAPQQAPQQNYAQQNYAQQAPQQAPQPNYAQQAPQGSGNLSPQGAGSFVPQGASNFAPQSSGYFAPQSNPNFAPQQNYAQQAPQGSGNFAPPVQGQMPAGYYPNDDNPF